MTRSVVKGQDHAGQRPEAEQREGKSRRLVVLLALALAVSAFSVYGPSLGSPFVFDDLHRIVTDDAVRDPSAIRLGARPVLMLSFALNHATSGLDPTAFRLTNVLIHALAAWTLFGIVRRSLESDAFGPRPGGRPTWIAFIAAWLWLVHPLHTQAVTYVWQRGESLMGLFYLLTLYCVIRSDRGPRSRIWAAAAVVSFLLGAGTKEVIVSAPLVVLAYDRTFLTGSFRAALRKRRGLYGAFLALGLLGLALRGLPTRFAADSTLTNLEYASAQPGVVLHYLRLALWPDPLCFDYAWPAPARTAEVARAGAAVGALAVAALVAFVHRSWIGFAGLWLFSALAPTSSFIVINDVAVEYRMYVALAAVAAIVSALLVRAGECTRAPRVTTVALVAVVGIALAWTTVQRNRVYASPITLWQDTVDAAPHNARAHNQLSLALLVQGRKDEAFEHVEKAVELDPGYGYAHGNLGTALASRGQTARAIEHLELALRHIPPHDPAWLKVRLSLADVLIAERQFEEAEKHLGIVLGARPRYDDVRRKLVRVLADRGRYRRAGSELLSLVQATPADADMHLVLAAALFGKGHDPLARSLVRKAVSLSPEAADPAGELLLAVLTTSKDRREREELLTMTEEFCAGSNPTVERLARLARAYASMERYSAAADAIGRAIALAESRDEAKVLELQRLHDHYERRSRP